MHISIISSFLDLLIRTQVLVLLVLLPHLLSFVSTWCPMFSGVWAGLHNYYLSFIDTRHAVTCVQYNAYLWHIYVGLSRASSPYMMSNPYIESIGPKSTVQSPNMESTVSSKFRWTSLPV